MIINERVVVQICTSSENHLFALCNDGTMWFKKGWDKWGQVESVPETKPSDNYKKLYEWLINGSWLSFAERVEFKKLFPDPSMQEKK